VRGVFDSVAGKYDLMNDLMSAGMHRMWKRFTVEIAGVHGGARVLDLAGGTGDLARLFAERAGPTGVVVHTDINGAMLVAGRDKLIDRGVALPTVQCNAEALPFADRAFDCVSIACRLPVVSPLEDLVNRLLVLALAAFAALAMVQADFADAARMGGGRSMGMQRSITPPAARTAPSTSNSFNGPAANPVLPAKPGATT